MTKKTDVMLVGEPMILFIGQEEAPIGQTVKFERAIAGAELNVGIGLSRLGYKVSYLTKLAEDEFGEYIIDYLHKEQLNTEHIKFIKDGRVGIMFKNKVAKGDPSTLYYRKHSAASTMSEQDVSTIDFSEIRLLHVTGIFPALSQDTRNAMISMVKKAKESGCIVSFDPNLRPSLWDNQEEMISVLNKIADYSDIVLPGVSEGEILTGKKEISEIAQFYLDKGASMVVIKDGSRGAYVQTTDELGKHIKGYPVEKVIDTVGAGDGFAVGIISGQLDDLDVRTIVKQANAIGAMQVQHISDNEALPDRNKLAQFMKEHESK